MVHRGRSPGDDQGDDEPHAHEDNDAPRCWEQD